VRSESPLKEAAAAALAATKPGVGMDSRDRTNPWAVFDNTSTGLRPSA
jgi:hypothetical protein